MGAEPHRFGADWRDVIQTELVVIFRIPDIPYVGLLCGQVLLVRINQEFSFGSLVHPRPKFALGQCLVSSNGNFLRFAVLQQMVGL